MKALTSNTIAFAFLPGGPQSFPYDGIYFSRESCTHPVPSQLLTIHLQRNTLKSPRAMSTITIRTPSPTRLVSQAVVLRKRWKADGDDVMQDTGFHFSILLKEDAPLQTRSTAETM